MVNNSFELILLFLCKLEHNKHNGLIDIIIRVEDEFTQKRLISVCAFKWSRWLNLWIMWQLWTFKKKTKYWISCLIFFLCSVWIYVCLQMKGLVILRIRTCLKNSLKIGFIAVDLTEVSSSTKIGNFHFFSNISANYHISAILVVYLDGRLHALSFDILHATFLGYQVLVQICRGVMLLNYKNVNIKFLNYKNVNIKFLSVISIIQWFTG